MDDRDFLSHLVRVGYPDKYFQLHGEVSEHMTLKRLREIAKDEGVPCFNYMMKRELVDAINAKKKGFGISGLVSAARERFSRKAFAGAHAA